MKRALRGGRGTVEKEVVKVEERAVEKDRVEEPYESDGASNSSSSSSSSSSSAASSSSDASLAAESRPAPDSVPVAVQPKRIVLKLSKPAPGL